jgi:hypothetical protein
MRLLFISFFFLSFSLLSIAQIDVAYKVEAAIDMQTFTLHGHVEITVRNVGEHPINELPIEIWPNAYQKKGTYLAQERLEDQKIDLNFGNSLELGKVDSLNFNATIYFDNVKSTSIDFSSFNSGELYVLNLDQPLNKGNYAVVHTDFRIELPSSHFNGFGADEYSVRLSKWFPRISGFEDSTFYVCHNNIERYSLLNKSSLQVSLAVGKETNVISSIAASKSSLAKNNRIYFYQSEDARDLVLLLFPSIYTFDVPLNLTNNQPIRIYYDGDLPKWNYTDGFKNILTFMKSELNIAPPDSLKVLILKDKKAFESSNNLIVIDKQINPENSESEIVEEWVKLVFSETLNINSAKYPWLVKGMAHYYRTLFLRTYYPDKLFVGPIGESFVGRFFDADEYPFEYRNIFLFQFMARQGLDQAMSDSALAYPKFNKDAILKGKTALNLEYLRMYCGERAFKQSIYKFIEDGKSSSALLTPEDYVNSFKYYVFQDLDWFLGDVYQTDLPYNYKLSKTEDCSYVYTATVINTGKVVAPYSLTGIKDGKPVLTEWKPGHVGKKTVQMHLEEYDKVVLNYSHRFPEFNQKENTLKTTGLFKRAKPLKLQFYTSFENPDKTQIFWLPSLKYNAYDQFLIGASFYNSTFVQKPFEYKFTPEFSTGTLSLVGSGSLKYNWTLHNSIFRQISAGLYGRYYHYAEDLAFTRLSPAVNFYLKKPSPRSNIIRHFRLRAVYMDKELPSNFDGNPFELDFASYQVLNLQYIHENVNVLRPMQLTIGAEASDLFSKLQVDYLQRFKVSKNHTFALRVFGGVFMHNQQPNNDNFYSFGLSGTRDYMFDYYFVGRSDQSGIWSQQMYETDGGFKSQTNTFDNKSMLAINAKVPIWRYFKLFGDIGWTSNEFAWDYGASIIIVPDFLEIHFPFQSNQANFLQSSNYVEHIRYVLNLDPTRIVNRLRRGYY